MTLARLQRNIAAAAVRSAAHFRASGGDDDTALYDQSHLLADWEDLSPDQQEAFTAQLDLLFPDAPTAGFIDVASIFHDSVAMSAEPPARMAPPTAADVTDLTGLHTDESRALEDAGLSLLLQGRGAVVILAGGSGTRLGTTFPKGQLTCPDLVLPKTLFQLHCEKIRAMEARLDRMEEEKGGKGEGKGKSGGFRIPLLYMTSNGTDAATRAFFLEHNYFGLADGQVRFFQQSTMPCFTANGKIILEKPGKIGDAPGGNAGIYAALAKSGELATLKARGVTHCHICTVDNILTVIPDTALFGTAREMPVDVVVKTVAKTQPSEAVGVFARRTFPAAAAMKSSSSTNTATTDTHTNDNASSNTNSDTAVLHWGCVEYTELGPTLSEERDPQTGALLHNYANIAIHLFSLGFLERMAEVMNGFSYYHVARKPIPTALAPRYGGTAEGAASVAGVKLEAFIFDLFQFAPSDKFRILQCDRALEFSAIKNAEPDDGSAKRDTPVTAVRDLRRSHTQWLANSLHALLLSSNQNHIQQQQQHRDTIEAFSAITSSHTMTPTVMQVELSPLVASSERDLLAVLSLPDNAPAVATLCGCLQLAMEFIGSSDSGSPTPFQKTGAVVVVALEARGGGGGTTAGGSFVSTVHSARGKFVGGDSSL